MDRYAVRYMSLIHIQNNWSAVCAGSVGSAFLYFGTDEEIKTVLPRIKETLEYYLKGFGDDGACVELSLIHICYPNSGSISVPTDNVDTDNFGFRYTDERVSKWKDAKDAYIVGTI